MNTASWIILGILIAIVALIIFIIIRNRIKGKGGCSCCSSENCPIKKRKKE